MTGIRWDVLEGFVSRKRAHDVYGVLLKRKYDVDEVKTVKLGNQSTILHEAGKRGSLPSTETLILSKEEVRNYLSMGELIDQMETAFLAFHRGAVEMPQRLRIVVPEAQGYGAFMPCSIAELGGFGIKVNTNFKQNPRRFGLPAIIGLILLLDIESGVPLAIMDSTLVTAVRTAAVSGLAARYLARDDSETVGVLGSGVQSIPHIEAMAEVRNIKNVFVYSPSLASRSAEYLASVKEVLDARVEAASGAEEVVSRADILVVCTDSPSPVLDGSWIREGSCIIAIGNATPHTRELDTKTVTTSRIVCDSSKACMVEAGDLLIPLQEASIQKEEIQLDLGHVIQDPSLGRKSREEIILFKSVGLAFEDIMTVSHIYRKAVARGDALTFHFI